MPSINLEFISAILLLAASLCYVPMIVAALRKRAGQEATAALLVVYVLISLGLMVLEAIWRGGWLEMEESLLRDFQLYGALGLAVMLLALVRLFLRLRGGEFWLVIGLLFFGLIALLSSDILNLPEILWSNGRIMLPRYRLVFGALVIGWVAFFWAAILTTITQYRRTPQPLHRNRISYWGMIFTLLVVNDGLLIAGWNDLGGLLRLMGVGLMVYVLTRHALSDSRQILRQALIYINAGLLIVLLYLLGYRLYQFVYQNIPGSNSILLGSILTLLLVVVFILSFNLIRKLIFRIMPVERYNISQTLREYSLNISNILDLQKLASVAMSLIIDAMDIRRGFLFLVDKEKAESETQLFHLRAVRAPGETPLRAGILASSSPIVGTLSRERHPLLQYDIDLLPVYRKVPASEREWLAGLETEVYVPIFAKNEWIGLFALGAKASGNRYTDEDLTLLSTLADQTAVALENARLVENLVQVNTKLTNAYQALNQANRSLARLDRTKSNFISIASHELRSPLTVLRGYTEMLLEDPVIKQSDYHHKTIEGIHKGTIRLHEIMDSMFDIAQIDARTLELQMQSLDVGELIRGVCSGMATGLAERKQVLTIDIPAMPTVKADPNTIRKVFYHLVTNAIKFTPNGGKITVTGRQITTPQNDLPAGGIEIVVADTGVGVDPNYRELIFTKFYQGEDDLNRHSTGKTKFKGSGAGLGLTLSRGIVEAHGGRIWVESPGYDEVNFPGSRFHVVLPLRRQGDSNTVRISEAVHARL